MDRITQDIMLTTENILKNFSGPRAAGTDAEELKSLSWAK
jgi:hypothetical protein